MDKHKLTQEAFNRWLEDLPKPVITPKQQQYMRDYLKHQAGGEHDPK